MEPGKLALQKLFQNYWSFGLILLNYESKEMASDLIVEAIREYEETNDVLMALPIVLLIDCQFKEQHLFKGATEFLTKSPKKEILR